MPQVTASEFAVLSILMNDPTQFEDCDKLQPEHFPSDWLRATFAEMRSQHAKGPFDIITLSEALTGTATLTELHSIHQHEVMGRRSISAHVQRLIDGFKSRQLYHMSGLLHTLSFETTPIQERVDIVQTELAKLEDSEDYGDWISAHESSMRHLDLLEAREAGTVTGMDTGIPDLDNMLDGGFQRGNLVVIGARPAMGKSALGLTMGLHMSQHFKVGFISMEMSRDDIADRQAAILGSISISSIKQPKKGLQYDRIVEAVKKSRTRSFYVVEQAGLNILQVKAKAKALQRRHGLDVLIVDYIGLMSGLDSKVSRAYQIEEISRGLKTLAKELSIVVVCLAQVNRGAADKGNQPPSLHELRDSGAIEQDADVVGFIHRPIQAQPELGPEWAGYALLRVAKNRQGRCGDINLFYVAEQTKFASWSGAAPTKSQSKSGRHEL